MSEEQDKPDAAKPESEPEGPRCGERLAAARREQQVSVLEVAKELHLDEPKVRALERNDFDMLGAPVFAKGHLRKYAHLVGVDEADVFADYYQLTRSERVPPPVVVVGRSRVRQELSPGPWIAVIVVIIVAAATYWWFAMQSDMEVAPTPGIDEPLVPEQDADSAEAVEQPVVVTSAIVEDEQPSAATPLRPEPVQVPDGETRVSLTFSGDCWTEISDATGQRLFFAMGRNGRTVELTGTAPFTVLFGNFENVSVRVDGDDYPISPSTPGSRTARLTIMNR